MDDNIIRPQSPAAMASLIANTMDPVRIIGAGSKRNIGLPVKEEVQLVSTSALAQIPYFEPSEFVIAAQAGVKVSDLQAKLLAHELSLPFHHPWMDQGATLGGVIATNLGGDERLDLGAPRDNVLGIEYVNGNGELLRAGGRVMKNVTGLDMGRALAGSWGRLAVLTEIALKVVPAARMPEAQFAIEDHETPNLWRISVPAVQAEALHERLGACLVASRWHGALAWAATSDDAWDGHAIAQQFDGHALRVRGQGRAFQPQAAGVKRLEAQVKSALDPRSIFDSQYDG